MLTTLTHAAEGGGEAGATILGATLILVGVVVTAAVGLVSALLQWCLARSDYKTKRAHARQDSMRERRLELYPELLTFARSWQNEAHNDYLAKRVVATHHVPGTVLGPAFASFDALLMRATLLADARLLAALNQFDAAMTAAHTQILHGHVKTDAAYDTGVAAVDRCEDRVIAAMQAEVGLDLK